MSLTLEEIDEVIAEYKKLRTELVRTKGKPILAEAITPHLAGLPDIIQNVWWRQGTPSFCDGDPCYFSVYDVYFNHDEDGSDYEGLDGWTINYYLNEQPTKSSWQTDERHAADVLHHAERREELLEEGWTTEAATAMGEAGEAVRSWIESHMDFLDELFGNAIVIVNRDGSIEDDEAYFD